MLGRRGAYEGLLHAEVSTKALISLARRMGDEPSNEIDRSKVIDTLLDRAEGEKLLPLNQLMEMSFEELEDHFARVKPSADDLLRVMKQLDYKVSSSDKKNLRRFAARQISETALFSNVAGKNAH
jgi:hypothetical protein